MRAIDSIVVVTVGALYLNLAGASVIYDRYYEPDTYERCFDGRDSLYHVGYYQSRMYDIQSTVGFSYYGPPSGTKARGLKVSPSPLGESYYRPSSYSVAPIYYEQYDSCVGSIYGVLYPGAPSPYRNRYYGKPSAWGYYGIRYYSLPSSCAGSCSDDMPTSADCGYYGAQPWRASYYDLYQRSLH